MVFKDFQVIKRFFIYSSGAIIVKAITASITLIAIRFLNPAEYGLLSLLNTFINIFPIFLNLGLRQAFSINFFHVNHIERKKMINDVVAIYLNISIPILFILFFNLANINQYIFLNQIKYQVLFIVILICFLHFFTELLFQTLRYYEKAFELTAIQICMSLINIFFSILFIYFFRLKILGIIIANLVSMFTVVFYGFYLYIKKVGLSQFNFFTTNEKVYYYLKLGFPFIPSILFNWLMSFGDRWILLKYATMNEVGIYSVADSFGQLYQMLVLYPLAASYVPYMFRKFSENKDKVIEIDKWNLKNMWISMVVMLVIVTLLFFLFKNFFYFILPKKYYTSIDYIWFILLEQIIFMGSYFANCYLQFFKRTYIFSGLIMLSASVNIFLNILLIPYFSIYGAVVATIISYIFYLFSILFSCKMVKKSQFNSLNII